MRRLAFIVTFALMSLFALGTAPAAADDAVTIASGGVVSVGNGHAADIVLAPGERVTLVAALVPACERVAINADWDVLLMGTLTPGESYAMWAGVSLTLDGPSYFNDGQSDQEADPDGRVAFILPTGQQPGFWTAHANPSGTPRWVPEHVVATCEFET